MADMKVKCLADREGFTKDTEYPVIAFGDAHCILRDDAGHVVALGYATINDAAAWSLNDQESEKVPTLADYSKGDSK